MLTITLGVTLICLRPFVRVCSQESGVASPGLQRPRRGSRSAVCREAELSTVGQHCLPEDTQDKPLPASAPRHTHRNGEALSLKSLTLVSRELGNLIKERGFSFPEAENCVPSFQGISEPPWPLKVKERRTRSHNCYSPTVSCDNSVRTKTPGLPAQICLLDLLKSK